MLAVKNIPDLYQELLEKSEEIGFAMPSDLHIGNLLKSLIASKPGGRFLELGTGIGLSLSWMLEGMDKDSSIISIDNDAELIKIAKSYFQDLRLDLVQVDGTEWIKDYRGPGFDLIFADAWPGKYSEIEETLDLLNVGGLYVIDDMNAQPNWPDGHQKRVDNLVEYLESRSDFTVCKLDWSTGVIIATKIAVV